MTDSNQKPPRPNYVPDVGRLVTDRFDFQQHVGGAAFRHQASSIDLSPSLVVGGNTVTNLQDAVSGINTLVGATPITLATSTVPGTVQLSPSGDVQGTATKLRVVNIQGIPISTLPPTSGQVLTFSSGAWTPATPAVGFTASGDLAGNNVSQTVVGLTGSSNVVSVHSNSITWDISKTPSITQLTPSVINTPGTNFSITAQSGNVANGGNLILKAGAGALGNPSALAGGVSLKAGDGSTGVQFTQLSAASYNQFILSLVNPNGTSGLTSSQVPSNAGDMVIFIGDALATPTAGVTPVGGTILYSNAGKLNITQGDGTNFIIGQLLNPNIWGNGNQLTVGSPPVVGSALKYEYNAVLRTTTNSAQAIDFVLSTRFTSQVDVIMIGNSQSNIGNAACYTLKVAFTVDGSNNVTIIGTVTTIDSRHTAGAAAWGTPNISTGGTGGNMRVTTGFGGVAETVDWAIVTTITSSR